MHAKYLSLSLAGGGSVTVRDADAPPMRLVSVRVVQLEQP